MAAFWIAFSVPGPLGAAALTAIAERAGAGSTLVGMTIGALALFTPAGHRRPHRRPRSPTASPRGIAPSLVDHPGVAEGVG